MFDDVIEHGSPEAFRYLAQVIPYIMNYMSDTDPNVRQAAVYGIGVVADKAREYFAPLVEGLYTYVFDLLFYVLQFFSLFQNVKMINYRLLTNGLINYGSPL
jgi:hypothetical protein